MREYDKMRHIVRRFGALQFVAGGRQFRVCFLNCGRGSSEIVLHFRYFQSCEQLSFVHSIADVDFDLADIAGDLGHDIDFLKGLELGCQH